MTVELLLRMIFSECNLLRLCLLIKPNAWLANNNEQRATSSVQLATTN